MNFIGLLSVLVLFIVGITARAQQSVSETIATYKYPVKYLQYEQANIAYIDEGSGEKTLLFVHGLATYLPSWYPQVAHFRSGYRCIALDLPGYGRSSKGDFPATMDYYAEVLMEVIDQLQLSNVVPVGHSMGAQVAVTTVLNNPTVFEELVLLAPAGFETFEEEQANWLKAVSTLEVICGADSAQIRANWEMNFYEMPATVDFMIADRMAMTKSSDFGLYGQSVVRGIHGMLDGPVFDRLGQITARTLVVYGANDALIPNKYLNAGLHTKSVAARGMEQLKNGKLAMVEQCGHFITYDKPEEVNEIIDSFLKN